MKRLSLILLFLIAILSACGDPESESSPADATDTVDAIDTMNTDVTPDTSEDVADTEDIDVPPLTPRTMLETPVFHGLPSDNRVFAASLSSMSGSLFGSDDEFGLSRQFFADSPHPLPTLELSSSESAAAYFFAMAGEGLHDASIWIGIDDQDIREEALTTLRQTSVSAVGVTLEEATRQAVSVDLSPTNTPVIASNGRLWMEFGGTFASRTGPFILLVRAPSVRVHAPIVRLSSAMGSGLSPRVLTPRAVSTQEHAILYRVMLRLQSPQQTPWRLTNHREEDL